jgi:hypothetical protein
MFGTDTLLTGVETHSVIRLNMQTPQRADTKETNAIFLNVLIEISFINIRIVLQIHRICHGHI